MRNPGESLIFTNLCIVQGKLAAERQSASTGEMRSEVLGRFRYAYQEKGGKSNGSLTTVARSQGKGMVYSLGQI